MSSSLNLCACCHSLSNYYKVICVIIYIYIYIYIYICPLNLKLLTAIGETSPLYNLNCAMVVGDCQKCRPELHDYIIKHAVYLHVLASGHTNIAVFRLSVGHLGHYLLHTSFLSGTFSKVRAGGRPLPLYYYSLTAKKFDSWTREATV